jgi:hypothetical protein
MEIIKSILPNPIVKAIQKFRRRRRLEKLRQGILERFKGQTLEDTFNTIYTEGIWGEGSGPGSEGAWADGYIDFVRKFIDEKNIKSITDVGCGDFRVGAKIIGMVDAYNAADVSDLIIERLEVGNGEQIECMFAQEYKIGLYLGHLVHLCSA